MMVLVMVTEKITGKKSKEVIPGLGAGMVWVRVFSPMRAISSEIE
jgi:hypothetical protein